MIKKMVLVLMLFLIVGISFAQEYSRPKAIIMSALVPGSGQLYSGQKTMGSALLAAEIGLILSLFRFDAEINWGEDHYQEYAYQYTGIEEGSDSALYQDMHTYESSEKHNEAVIRDARNYYLIYTYDPDGYQAYVNEHTYSGDSTWNWETRDRWMKYRSIRKRKQGFEVYKNLAISGIVINHLFSTIQTIISTRPKKTVLSQLNNLTVQPDYKNDGVNLVYTYRF